MIQDLDDDTEAWIDAIVPILETVRKRDGSEQTGLEMIEENFRVPGDAATYVDTLAVLYDRLDAPNEEEYTLRPSEDTTPSSLVSVFVNRPSKGNLREETTKAIYMMLAADEDWKWGKLITAIEDRFNLIYNEESQMSEISQEEYAGLVGSLIVLASQGDIPEAKKMLERKRNDGSLYISLSLSREHAASAAACTLALLFVGEQMDRKTSGQTTAPPVSRSQKASAKSSPDSSSKNHIRREAEKGSKLFGKIISNPSRHQDRCEKMYDLIQRTSLNIHDKSDWKTNRDLKALQKFMSKLEERST